jgi:hypothetical protein
MPDLSQDARVFLSKFSKFIDDPPPGMEAGKIK